MGRYGHEFLEFEFRADGREDDQRWPKKNVVGRQELEIRLGNEHISFE
ncbi:12364_t:CDS:2, partial [Racocetra fulgida]